MTQHSPVNIGGRPLAAVTGASSGIGEIFARKLATQGYDLLLVARRRDRLEALAAELSVRNGITPEVLAADLTRDYDVARVAERLAAARNLDTLVNNAGFGSSALFHEADAASQELMHRLHVLATMRLCRAALPGMVARKSGFIVNVSSVSGFMQAPFNISYCATKTWMNSFSEGLHLEMCLAHTGVVVQALCPGFTYTEFHDVMQATRETVPSSWWMSSDDVVEASLTARRSGKLFVVPGWRYKLIVAFLRVIPRGFLHAIVNLAPNVRRGAQKRAGMT